MTGMVLRAIVGVDQTEGRPPRRWPDHPGAISGL
jgi:hypothetical protein